MLSLVIIIFVLLLIININLLKEQFAIKNDRVNIIISCDKKQFIGLLATINSICIHSNNKYNMIDFYFLVDKKEKPILENMIKTKFPYKINYKIKEINDDQDISNNIRVNNKAAKTDNIMNFARFNFPQEFPKLDKILYIDADIIIKDDIIKLYNNCNTKNSPFYAVNNYTFSEINDIYDLSYYNPNEKYFNAGLYITSLNYWRNNNFKSKIIKIMKNHKNSKKGLFSNGTQPILNIIFYKNFKVIPKEWNTTGLGGKIVDKKYINKAKGLHWNGKHKPWNKDGLNKQFWKPYELNI